MYTEQLTQALSVAAHCDPTTLNTGGTASLTSGAVDLSKFRRLMALVLVGANAGSITAKLQAAKTSGGAYSDVTGSTLTAITAANKQATIELRQDQIESILGAGYQFVKLVITQGSAADSICAGVILGGEAEHEPASAQDPASVTQRLVL